MTINVSNLILTLQQKIDSTTNEADLLYYAKALQQLKTGQIFSVASATQLPNSQENIGFLYYAVLEELVYFATVYGWIPLYDTSPTVIFSWGCNSLGKLGDGTVTNRCSPVREVSSSIDWCQVSAGYSHATMLKTSGQLWSWGCSGSGELGDGTVNAKCSPVREICGATDWCQASAINAHTAAVKTSGELWVWGCNNCGQLGVGTVSGRCSPVREICSATDWCRVAGGYHHTVALKTSGQIWTWGTASFGGLGDGTTVSKCSPIREFCSATDWCQVSAGRYHTAAVKTTGQLWAWGRNNSRQIGDGTSIDRCSPVREFCSATDWCVVTSKGLFNTAIKTSGQIWAWGNNACGPLGDGTTTSRCSPVREFCSATDWCGVSAGCCHVIAIKTTGQLWAWGFNSAGMLGDGTTTTRCSPIREFCSATDWCQVGAGFCQSIAIRNLSF